MALAYTPVTLTASGGTAPYYWMLGSGTPPAGLTVSPAGMIAGTPSAAGQFNFTIEVNDTAGTSVDLSETITIVPRLTASLAGAGTITMREGSATTSGAFASMAGGQPPYAYAVSSGSLPAGTSLNGLSLSGTYSTAGTYRFTVTVTDGFAMAAAVSPAYYVWGAIAFPVMWYTPSGTADHRFNYADVDCGGTNAKGCSAQFPYLGGTPGVTPVVSSMYTQAAWQGIPNYFPGQDTALHGLSVTVSGGNVHLVVAANANPNGWTAGKVFVVLMDPQTRETTRPAEFRITIFS